MGATVMRTVVSLAGATIAYSVYAAVQGLRKNIAAARRSGLKYVISPWSPLSLPWQVSQKIWSPLIRCLPRAWWEDWLDIMTADWSFRTLHEPFSRFGEAFFVVSPYMLILYTDNAEVTRQVSQRREHFPKFTESYKILAQFGESVLTTEGAQWRFHRKVTSASFNERNAALVFAVAAHQAQGMIGQWEEERQKGRKTISTVEHDTMRLALNIIGYVGFGLKLLWPGQKLPPGTDSRLYKYTSLEPVDGHSMSFVDTIAALLENILMLLIMPPWLLKLIPSSKTKLAADAHDNYVRYMDELLDEKIDQLRNGGGGEPGMDLMGQLARSTYGGELKDGHANGSTGKASNAKSGATMVDAGPTFTKSDILGNAFIMLVAGHETTANALHFTLLELAARPASQRKLQQDIDALFGDKDPATWNYEGTVNAMMACMIGACMNETLRKMPSVVEMPKHVYGQDQTVTMDGKTHLLPQDTMIILTAVATHRNPRYWPTKPSRITGRPTDIDDYVPERWFLKDSAVLPRRSTTPDSAETTDAEDFGGYMGPDTSVQLFRPERGAYLPFSDGPRSCLGRRIAQVEIMAALAVIFQRYTLELAVDEWASDDEVENMSQGEKEALYKKAQDKCRATINQAKSILTLKLQDIYVPVRLAKRGEERFVSLVDR